MTNFLYFLALINFKIQNQQLRCELLYAALNSLQVGKLLLYPNRLLIAENVISI